MYEDKVYKKIRVFVWEIRFENKEIDGKAGKFI